MNFTETSDIVDDVNRLSNNSSAQLRRNFQKADIVVLLTNGNYGAVNGRVQAIGPSESQAYTIVQVGAATSVYTFIHEVGHLIGARHQNDPTSGDAHGYSWSKPGVLNAYGSIMQTRRAGLTAITRVLHFSNPYRQHEGENTGTLSYNFNARVINVNGSIVEDFRFAGPNINMSVSILGPSSAEDYDPLSFTGTVSNGQSPYTYLWEIDTGSGYTQAGTASSFNTTMPLDDDLNVRFTATGSNGVSASKTRFVRNLNENGGCGDECPDLNDTANVVDQKIAMSPNPVMDILILQAPDQLKLIDIYNSVGNLLYSTERVDTAIPSQTEYSIDVSSYPAGLYILKTTSQKGQTSSFKFIKK